MIAFILGILVGAVAVILGAAIYSICKASQIEQFRPRSGRIDFTGIPITVIEKCYEKCFKEENRE